MEARSLPRPEARSEGVRKESSLIPSPSGIRERLDATPGPLGGRPPLSHVLGLGQGADTETRTKSPAGAPRLFPPRASSLVRAGYQSRENRPFCSSPVRCVGDATADLVDGRPPGGPGSPTVRFYDSVR